MKNKNEKKKPGVLDYFIIFALVAVVICFAVRFIKTQKSQVSEKVELEDYVISFTVSGIRDSSAKNYMTPGSRFYIKDTGVLFGEMRENLTITDAEKFYELDNGEVVVGQNNAIGDLYRVDVEASVNAKGKMDANGCFLLGGNTYVGVNKTFTINSKYLSIIIMVTDITKS